LVNRPHSREAGAARQTNNQPEKYAMYEDDPMMDSILAECYDIKEQIARECGYDLDRMFAQEDATMRRLEAQGYKFRYAAPTPSPPFPYSYTDYINMCLEARKRDKGTLGDSGRRTSDAGGTGWGANAHGAFD
jgi:hypothetical protein